MMRRSSSPSTGTPRSIRGGRNFGHLAYRTDDIYALCKHLMDMGVTINRPPRDGHMAFVRSPDGISVELIQNGTCRRRSLGLDAQHRHLVSARSPRRLGRRFTLIASI